MADKIIRPEYKEEVFKEYLKSRKIILNNHIEPALVEQLIMPIYKFNQEDDDKEAKEKNYDRSEHPIRIYINSRGGALHETLSAVSAIKESKTPIYTIALGYAMSGGFGILIAGHKRYCQKYSVLLYHQMSSGTWGKLQDMIESTEYLKLQEKRWEQYVVNNTRITQEKLDENREKKVDWYMFADEALSLGVVDEIL